MEKIVICLFVCCVALLASQGQATTVTVMPSATVNDTKPMTTAMGRNETVVPQSSSPAAPTASTAKPEATPKSGVVSVKAFAGFVSFFALIALF